MLLEVSHTSKSVCQMYNYSPHVALPFTIFHVLCTVCIILFASFFCESVFIIKHELCFRLCVPNQSL